MRRAVKLPHSPRSGTLPSSLVMAPNTESAQAGCGKSPLHAIPVNTTPVDGTPGRAHSHIDDKSEFQQVILKQRRALQAGNRSRSVPRGVPLAPELQQRVTITESPQTVTEAHASPCATETQPPRHEPAVEDGWPCGADMPARIWLEATELSDMRRQNERLKFELEELRSQQVPRETPDRLRRAEDRIAQLQLALAEESGRVELAELKAKELQRDCDHHRAENGRLQSELRKATNELAALRAPQLKAQEYILLLEQRLRDLECERAIPHAEHEELAARLKAREESLRKLSGRFESLQDEYTTLASRFETQSQLLDEAERERLQVEQQLESAERELFLIRASRSSAGKPTMNPSNIDESILLEASFDMTDSSAPVACRVNAAVPVADADTQLAQSTIFHLQELLVKANTKYNQALELLRAAAKRIAEQEALLVT